MSETIEKLKKIEIAIFKEFISICKKYNFKYYLLGGTLLGAVRHKGFIPWDDDIDVGMPRDDYERFLAVAKNELPGELFLQTNKTDPQNPFCYCKIRNSNTTFIESPVRKLDMNHGIFIDVFPLDFYPSNPREQKKFQKKKRLYDAVTSSVWSVERTSFKQKLKGIAKKILVLFFPVKRAIKKREKMYTSQDDKALLANNGGAWGVKEIVPADWYGQGTELEFEGMKVMAPEKYDLWLTQVYGDYIQLPPAEKRVSHHETEIIDADKSYKEYLSF